MKKLVLLFLCCALMGGSICNAEIREGKTDKFDGSKYINSINSKIVRYDVFNFHRKMYTAYSEYDLYVSRPCVYYIENGYSVESAQIKVDDIIYPLSIMKKI